MLKDKGNSKITGFFLVLTVLFAALAFLPKEIFATTIFSNGFEEGTISAWTGSTGTVTVETGISHHGTYGLNCTGTAGGAANVFKNFDYKNITYAGGYLKLSALPTTASSGLPRIWLVNIFNTTGFQDGVKAGIALSGGNYYWINQYRIDGVSTETLEATPSNATANTWYFVEVLRDLTNQMVQVYVDGNLKINITGLAQNDASNQVQFGCPNANFFTAPATIYVSADCFTVADAYIGPEAADSTAPTYSSLTTSTTAAGASCSFGMTAADEANLSHYIFGTNNTGSWSNNTAVAFSINPQTVGVSKTLNSTIGTIVGYQWFFNDTTNNWNSTSIQSLTTTDGAIPTFGSITGNTTYANFAVAYSCTVSDNVAVSGFIASWNNTGSWVNGTWTSGSSGTLTGTHNSTTGYIVSVRFYANDTTNNWAASSITNFTLTDGTAPTSSGVSSSSTTAGSTCTFAITITDETGLSHYIFSTNNGGSWLNATATALSTNPQTVNVNQALIGVAGTVVSYQWFFNDSSNNWGYSSVYTLTVTEVSAGGGGAGDGTTPTATPYQTPGALGAVTFQVANINVGTVNPNSTVKAQLHFQFSGSSYKLQSIIFQQPFNAIYVHDTNFGKATYIITNNGQGEGTVDLTFNIPADIPVQRFTGGFQVSAIDAFGGEHKSNGEITLIVAGAKEDFLYFLRENPIYILFIAIAVILVLFLIVFFSKRR